MQLRFHQMEDFQVFWQMLIESFPQRCEEPVVVTLHVMPAAAASIYCLDFQINQKEKEENVLLPILSKLIWNYLLDFICYQWLQKQFYQAIVAHNDILRDNAAVQKLFHSDIMQNKLIQQSLQILKESLKLRDILQEAKELTQMKHYLLQQDSGNDGFDLSGFFYFQCKDLKELAQKAFEQVFAAYLEEMEYRQVVCALQEFMQQQRPIVEVLHVIPQEDGSFLLLDEQQHSIQKQDITKEFTLAKELGYGYDDTLTAAMISLAPQKILLHQKINDNWLKKPTQRLLMELARDKITFCSGCSLCDKKKNNWNLPWRQNK